MSRLKGLLKVQCERPPLRKTLRKTPGNKKEGRRKEEGDLRESNTKKSG